MSRFACLAVISLLSVVIFISCQKPEENTNRINLLLDDSLAIGRYDSIRVEVLRPDSSSMGIIFSGPYQPDSDHKLKGLILPIGTPSDYAIRVTAYKSDVLMLEFKINISPSLISRPVIIFRMIVDSVFPVPPVLRAVTPTRYPLWTWSKVEPKAAYMLRLYKDGILFDSQQVLDTVYSPTLTLSLSDGEFRLYILTIDSARNQSSEVFSSVFLDRTPPSLEILTPIPQGRVTAINPSLTGIVGDTTGIRTLSYRIGSGTSNNLPLIGRAWSLTGVSIPVGICTLFVAAEDSVGNVANTQIIFHKWPNVVFVCEGGVGIGNSWQDCISDITGALWSPRAQLSGFQVWVSAGNYPYPFVYASQAKGGIYGGFSTTSNSLGV